MFTDVYVGLVKSDKFDYDKPGDPNSYSPDFALESLRPANKPYLSGERDLYWKILRHPNVKQTDWGCWVVKMTGEEMVSYLSQAEYHDNRFALFLADMIKANLNLKEFYLLTAMESPGLD